MQGRYSIVQGHSDTYRLELLTELTWPRSKAFLSSQGLNEGSHCLEVGCGSGLISEKLSGLVGNSGSVTGIDIDPESVQIAQARLSQHSNAIFHTIDVEACDSLDLPRHYDIIYCRLLLIHLKDPLSLLKKLKPLLVPSGILIVEDIESEFSCYPCNLAFSTLTNAVKQLWRCRECYHDLVEALPRFYQQCQLSLCGLSASSDENCELVKRVYALSFLNMKAAMLSENLLTEKIFDDLYKSVTHFFDQPYTLVFSPKFIMIAGKNDMPMTTS